MEELIEQHRAIRSAAAHLTALFDRPYQDAAPFLNAARSDVGRKIMRCLTFQDEVLMAPLRTRGLMARIASGAAVEARTREIRLLYSAHIVEWTLSAIAKDWPGYTASARHLNALLIELSALKEEHFYPDAIRLLGRR